MGDIQDAPLADLTVVDLSRALAGPHAAMLLGDMGARVIKVESPTGDDSRSWGPPFVEPPDGTSPESTYFLSCNRNKESVVLDLKSEPGKKALTALLERADVLIENFRPGVMERLGFSQERIREMNPLLVTLSITGFGHDGPESDRAGYDQIVQGEAGLMSLTGMDPSSPTKVGVPIADLLAALHGVYGVLTALLDRHRTGHGRVVHTSLLASVVAVQAFQATMWTVGGKRPQALGNQHPAIAPYGLFRASDGVVQVAVGNESLWKRFATLFDLDRPEWATNVKRVEKRAALTAAIEHALSKWGAREALQAMAEQAIPAGLIREVPEVFAWDQALSQGLALVVTHESLGDITLPGNAIRFDDAATSGGRRVHLPPPRLGEHTTKILEWLDSSPRPESTRTRKSTTR